MFCHVLGDRGRRWSVLGCSAQEMSKNEQGVIQSSGGTIVARGGLVTKGKCD